MILALLMLLLAPSAPPVSAADHPAVPAILTAAESLFQSMKARNYPAAWGLLTAKSRETIVSETEEAIRASGGKPTPKNRIVRDFETGGPVARDYWDAFLRRFDPDAALERSRWEMGSVGKNRAEVLLSQKGADRPAVLQMAVEDGAWKVGLVETFWGR